MSRQHLTPKPHLSAQTGDLWRRVGLLLTCAASMCVAAGCAENVGVPAAEARAGSGGSGGGAGGQAPGEGGSDGGGGSDDAASNADPSLGASFVWRGFHHEWLRKVVGFRVPHRISKLTSLIEAQEHSGDSSDTWAGSGDFTFGQNTGVDGNYMRPRGLFSAFAGRGLSFYDAEVSLSWTDDGDGGSYPQAHSTMHSEVVIELDPNTSTGAYGAFLRGYSLDVQCDDAKQPAGEPCNSNGMWPHNFHISIGECTVTKQTLRCPVQAQIDRAWTPNLGGLPPIETKPFNDKLDYKLNIAVTALHGRTDALRFNRADEMEAHAMMRDDEPTLLTQTIPGAQGDQYPSATSVLTSFGFELYKTQSADKFNHLGRYIGALHFGLHDGPYDPGAGTLDVEGEGQVWVPNTVANSGIRYRMGAAAVQLGPDASVGSAAEVQGQLCSNSSDQAPGFSAWNKCGTGDKGLEQQSDTATVAID